MRPKIPRLPWLVLPLAYLLYFFRLGGAGLIGPDEPRYAWIGRAMAQSGDWVTPRLWGQPWFEKPALLYWMSGAAFRLGLGPDVAPRLPVALMGTAFLAFYWWMLRREFGCRPAWFATLILGSSVAWLGFTQAGVPDLPLTATFSASMLLALPWIHNRDRRFLPAAALMLGLSVLAKGLVPLALAAPLAFRIRCFTDLLKWRVALPFLLVATPWYVLCYMRNGSPFLSEFFLRHHFERFTSGALLHVQPWWFYLARLPALMLPWTPLLLLPAVRRGGWRDPRRSFLLAWFAFGLILFSASANKLPGYVLPLLPAGAVLLGLALDEMEDARGWLLACAVLLVAFPIAAPLMPAAAANQWAAAPRPAFQWTWLTPAIPAAAAWMLESRGRRLAAMLSVTAAIAAGMVYLKVRTQPEMERIVTARRLAAQAAIHRGEICAGDIKRDWQYGLNYYLGAVVPDCELEPHRFRILQAPGSPPSLQTAPRITGAEARPPVAPR